MKWLGAMGWLILATAALLAVGCRNPIKVCANVVGHIDAPLKDTEPLRQMSVDPQASAAAKVAVIDVDGLLVNMNLTGLSSAGENPVEMLREKLDAVAKDACFRAIVVRINSPGGGAAACDMMWRDLQDFKQRTHLPVVASIMDVGAGGGYYLATAADQIYAHPTSMTGGISVILNRFYLQNLGEQLSNTYNPIKSGKYIDLGTSMQTLDDESFKVLQETARSFHVRFQEVVRQTRPLKAPATTQLSDLSVSARGGAEDLGDPAQEGQEPPVQPLMGEEPMEYEDFPEWCDGRVFTADQALELGLIDHIGYLDDAINLARQLAGCPQARVMVLHRRKDPAHTAYAITPNAKSGVGVANFSIPALERSRLPLFMYLWLSEPTLDSWTGR